MSSRISDLPRPLRWGVILGLAAAAVASLEFGGAALRSWRAFPPPLDRPMPRGLDWFSLVGALGDAARPAADVEYIACLQYMGGPNALDGFFGQTLPLYSRIQWLDPSFRHAVVEGISVLGWLYGRPAEAEILDRAAMASDPTYFDYGTFLGALGYQRRLDPKDVLRVLLPEVERPDAPQMVLRVYGNLLLKQKEWSRARDYWTWVLSRSDDGETDAMARRSLKEIAPHLGAVRP